MNRLTSLVLENNVYQSTSANQIDMMQGIILMQILRNLTTEINIIEEMWQLQAINTIAKNGLASRLIRTSLRKMIILILDWVTITIVEIQIMMRRVHGVIHWILILKWNIVILQTILPPINM